jgi:hypothetical protein
MMMANMFCTFEELGSKGDVLIECQIEFTIHEGERRTRDYPGSPPFVEFHSACVIEYANETEQVFRENREDLFLLLDKIAFKLVNEKSDSIQERILEREGI